MKSTTIYKVWPTKLEEVTEELKLHGVAKESQIGNEVLQNIKKENVESIYFNKISKTLFQSQIFVKEGEGVHLTSYIFIIPSQSIKIPYMRLYVKINSVPLN